jgi:hypothetical protein
MIDKQAIAVIRFNKKDKLVNTITTGLKFNLRPKH